MWKFTVLAIFSMEIVASLTWLLPVYGSENLPWSIGLVRAYCVWDNVQKMLVQEV